MTATKDKPMEGDLGEAIGHCEWMFDAYFEKNPRAVEMIKIIIRAAEENAALRARVRELEGVIYPFALAFHNAKSIHDPNTIHLQSHVVRATSFWLSYANFNKAQEAIKIKSGDVLGGGE